MTLAGQKRKREVLSAEPEQRQEVQSQTTPLTSAVAPATTVPEKKKRRTRKQAKEEELPKHPAAIFKTPSNPQATLEGLPAELRLQIYDHLCDSTLIHVHRHTDKDERCRFTWTPCRSPNPSSPLLCANPKWSGMCTEDDRCTYKIDAPPQPIGFWGLAATSKLIRNEAQEFFLRQTVISISPLHLDSWLTYLAARDPSRLDNLRRITLAGPNTYPAMSNSTVQILQNRVPNLEGVGLQCQDSLWRWIRSYANNTIQVDRVAWKRWQALTWLHSLDSSIEVAAEAMIWRKKHPRWRPNEVEQQVIVRVVRRGKTASAAGFKTTDEDVEVDIVQPGKLVACKRNAKWRQWWRTKETKGMAA